jgi:hypothetical protein
MSTCINLLKAYGESYRITWDPAYDAKGKHRENLDPWYAQIPCRGGTIYPFGGTLLAVEVNGHPGTTKKLLAVAGVRLIQDGDREKTFIFDVTLLPQVAEIVRPRKRKRLSEAQRRACTDRLAQVRPKFPASEQKTGL